MEKKTKRLHRVCMVNPQGYLQYPAPLGKTDTGGQTIYVMQLAKALAKRNIKVDILTRQFNDLPEEEDIFPNVKIVRVPCGPNTFVQKEKLYEYVPELIENFAKYMQRTKKEYDMIHSHYWDGGYGGYLLSKIIGAPHVHTPHSLGKLKKLELQQAEGVPLQKLKPMYRYHVRIAIEQKIMNNAQAIVVICETSRIQVLQHYIVDFEKLHVIYPGIETEYFNPKKNSVDRKINLAENAVLTVSRFAPAKGLDRIIDAMALIKNKVDFHLYMGGGAEAKAASTESSGELKEKSQEEKLTDQQLSELIKKYKMEKMIDMIGFVPHDTLLPVYYRGSKVFILGGRYEPFGLTTLEAMACGTVPVVSSVAGSREVIIDGLNGFVVDMHERKQLSERVLQLLTDHKLRSKVAENAVFTIQQHYSWDIIVEKFIQLYKSLL